MSKMKRKLELIYEMMDELSPSQKKAILEITYIDHIVELAFDFVKTLKGDKSKFSPTSEDQLKRLANLHLFLLQTKNLDMRKFSLSDRENEDALLELLVSSEEVQSVTKRILDHRKKLIDEYISEVIKPVDK